MSLITELDALKDHGERAVAAGLLVPAPHTLLRPCTVLHREVDNAYPGPYPLLEIFWTDRQVITLTPTQFGDMGQSFGAPSLYVLRVRSAVDPDNGLGVAEIQTEIMAVQEALEAWFAYVPNRCLPDAFGVPQVKYAGPPFRFRNNRGGPYQVADGILGQVSAGTITVIGIPRVVSGSG